AAAAPEQAQTWRLITSTASASTSTRQCPTLLGEPLVHSMRVRVASGAHHSGVECSPKVLLTARSLGELSIPSRNVRIGRRPFTRCHTVHFTSQPPPLARGLSRSN